MMHVCAFELVVDSTQSGRLQPQTEQVVDSSTNCNQASLENTSLSGDL